ncbi:MAG TPA: hypothetical protein VD883_03960, partial [Candidatus Omnitrophota bacterium]|nr:hypothetical protein [Candidatus Omnitrophota bacterium]
MKHANRLVIKGISFILALVFVADELSFAADGFRVAASDGVIPKDLGIVRQSVKGRSDKLIINIQDAHAKLGAQKSISEIIGKLAGRFDLRFVALEGSAGPVDTSLVSSFPDAASRKGAAEDLLKTGKISAAEFYSMVTGGKLPLYGVDNPKLHLRHVDALKALLQRRGAIRQEISPILALLSRLEKDILSERARFFLKNKLGDVSDEDSFGEDWKTLASLGALRGLDADAYEELPKFDRVVRLERQIDFREASRERNRLVEELGGLLEGKSLENFILQALRFKNDPSAAAAFHAFLSEQAAMLPGGPARYPNLTLYAAYLSIHDSMDLVRLLSELDAYKRSVREKVLSEEEKRFFEVREEFLTLNRLFLTSLTAAEYEGLTQRPFRDPAEWARELNRCREKYRPHEPVVSERFNAMHEAFPVAMRYYELAEARNRDLLKNTLRKMEEDGARVAVLVTGGFHSDGLADLMRGRGLSYTVVMPTFDATSPDRPYLALFTGKPEEVLDDPDALDDDLALRPYFDASWNSESTFLERKKSLALTLAHFYKAYGRFDETLRRQYVRSFARQHRVLAQKGASLSDLSPAVVAKMLKSTSLKEVEGGYEVRFPQEPPLVVSLSDGQVSVAGAPASPAGGRLSSRPEIISAAVFMAAAVFGVLPAASMGLFLAGAAAIRAATGLGILIHGLGHGVFTAVLDRSLKPLRFASISEGLSTSHLWRSLVPFGPSLYDAQDPGATAPRVPSGDEAPWKIRIKSLGGILFNIAFAAATIYFFPGSSVLGYGGVLDFIAGFTAVSLIAANGFFAVFSWSDIAAFLNGRAAFFYCGNFGIVAESRPEDNGEILPERFVRMALKMGRETEIRGEQAGGGLIFAEDKKGKALIVGKKIVNRKRHNLTEALEDAFLKERSRAAWKGLKRLPGLVKAAWHYRYGTSSKPAVIETHWHEWTEHRKARVWSLEKGKPVVSEKLVNHRITHNGDFDDWNIFGKDQSNADIGKWLERVLWTKNATKGDSPKVAGMMDLLITQGMWDASLRLAYQLAVAESMKDPVPTREEIRLMSQTAEKVFSQRLGSLFAPNALDLVQVKLEEKDALSADLARALARDPKAALWSEAKRVAFAKEAVHAFFYNHAFEATRVFISRAKGSFGLVVVSTLDRERMVLVSRGQPITLGFNIKEGYGIYASEPAAVNAVLKSDTSGEETFRLDLNQNAGEIAWMGAKTVGIYSLSEKRALRDEEISKRFIEMKDNP